MVEQEKHLRLDEIIESLEQQKLYPEEFDHYSALSTQINEWIVEYESQHSAIANALNSIVQLLRNFKA